jgi:hypothetical protein
VDREQPPEEHAEFRVPGRRFRSETEPPAEGEGETRRATLASTISEEVRAVFEAAESSAEAIRRQADMEARAIREAAIERARQIRSEAIQQSRDDVAAASQEATALLEQLEQRVNGLAALIQTLRSDAERLAADLAALEAEPRGRYAPPAPGQEEAVALREAGQQEAAPEAAIAATAPFAGEPEEARLLAFNMALNGAPREETERYLAENFDLKDRSGLLDAVYRRIGR